MSARRLPPASTFFWIGFLAESALIGVACLLGWWLLDDPFPFDPRFDAASLGIALLATLPPAAYAVFATSEAGLRFSPLRGIFDKVRDFLGDIIRELSLWQLVLLSAAAGFGEEFLFRGVLQQRFGIVFSSALFALLHAITPGYTVLALFLSLYLGWIYIETENIAVPAIVHTLYDVVALVLIRRQLAREDRPGE